MPAIEIPNIQNRTGRLMAAGGAALVALRAFRNGNRARGALMLLSAIAVALTVRRPAEHTATTVEIDTSQTMTKQDHGEIEVDVTMADNPESELRCAVCKEPIVPGQPRGPDAQNRTVHEACLQAAP
jgi:hypothetical protein